MIGAPKHASEIFIAAFNAAFEKTKDDGSSMAIAIAAVHDAGYRKNDKGEWMSNKSTAHKEWIPVFKVGAHIDSSGNEKTWTQSDLDQIVAQYHPQEHEAPVVIGHPKDNAPAWGWVESLKREGNLLYAKFKDVVPEFADMVRKGLFKKRSISLYPDMGLRHVGFLGAMPPAVKGLPDVAFQDAGGIYIEFGNCQACAGCNQIKNFCGKEAKSMKWFDWLKGKASAEGVSIEDCPSFAEPEKQKEGKKDMNIEAEVAKLVKAKELEFAEAQKVLDNEKARLKTESDNLARAKLERTKADIASFCEGLQKEGKLTPAMMKHGVGIQNFLERLSEITTPMEFSVGDAKKTQTPFEFMKTFLEGFGKQIEFGECAGNEKDMGKGNAGEKLSALTKQKMKEHKELSYSQAFNEAQRENRELAHEYAMEIRQ